tara:strand:+ start:55 stop:249 length:195 start_codon:yes stop_codon:yes gene_type:complete
MNQEQKAAKYDSLIRESDVVSRELSKIQSENIGVKNASNEYELNVKKLKNKLLYFENEMRKLFI